MSSDDWNLTALNLLAIIVSYGLMVVTDWCCDSQAVCRLCPFHLVWRTMNTLLKLRRALCICLIGSLLSGCNASSGTLPVTGKVTKGGQPVAGADVTFVPTAKEGKPASG